VSQVMVAEQAVVAGIVGYFVVLRSLSFAGHALSHIGFAGATGAVALGVNPIYGLLDKCRQALADLFVATIFFL